jgi:hypothetical protein
MAVTVLFFLLTFLFPSFLKKYILRTTNYLYLEYGFILIIPIFILYNIFYRYAPVFREMNDKYPPESYTPIIRPWIYEHDGIETYLLFILMNAVILLTFFLAFFWERIRVHIDVAIFFLALSMGVTYLYLENINWIPPLTAIDHSGGIVTVFLGIICLTGALYFLDNFFNYKWSFALIMLLLIPICFVAVNSYSYLDYTYVWAPAYRLVRGFALSDIYFQYDLLLSALAAVYMKLGINLGYFQILGQFSFFLFFLSILFFARSFFQNKHLYILFILFILVTRYFALIHDPTEVFQVTPLRLELWLILLFLFYKKGSYHWSIALALGILILVHKNFGLIYFICYTEVISWLMIVDFLDEKEGISLGSIVRIVKKHFYLNVWNLAIIFSFIILTSILFKGLTPKSAILYQKIGIGMTPIAQTSFYWYLPVLFAITFFVLYRLRHLFSKNYYTTGCFMIFLAVGNSMYFYGRSHEHNIINVAAILSLTLFLFFDIALFKAGGNKFHYSSIVLLKQIRASDQSPQQLRESYYYLGSVFMILLVVLFSGYYYSERIENRLLNQYSKIANNTFSPMALNPPTERIELVKKLTNNSEKVFFFDFQKDFLYEYYGEYRPLGYYYPSVAWVFNKDMYDFMQQLLDNNYYVIVGSDVRSHNPTLAPLKYDKIIQVEDLTIIQKF